MTAPKIVIELTEYELQIGTFIGCARRIRAIMLGFKGNNVDERREAEKNWSDHIIGACGELALAKYCRAYWTAGVGTHKNVSDVLSPKAKIEVKTRTAKWHDLTIRVHENEDEIAVLMMLDEERPDLFHLIGWIPVKDAKRKEWYQTDPFVAYFVPRNALTPFGITPTQATKEDPKRLDTFEIERQKLAQSGKIVQV